MAGRLLIESEPHPGAWNMAFDEMLLDAAAAGGETSLRIYRWSEPTLSLGYFQKTLPPDTPEPLRLLPRVRRLSGGGAILHDREWTYSCCVPKGHRLAARPEIFYEAVHSALVRAFASHGIGSAMRGETDPRADGAFLCFLRGDARDILIGGRKVVGSAQRRRKGAVLQHGSVLLRTSSVFAPVPGLLDLTGTPSSDPLFAVPEFLREVSPTVFDEPPFDAAPEALSAAGRLAMRGPGPPHRDDEDAPRPKGDN